MREINIDRGWSFNLGLKSGFDLLRGTGGRPVDLPHDYMIENEVTPTAPAARDSGFYSAAPAQYRKPLEIPADWEGDRIFLKFDGVMMNATVEVNGGRVALHHYGYSPFCVDITGYVYCGEANNVVVTIVPGTEPNCRWYPGAGILRSVTLVHTPALYIENDGIFAYTKQISYDEAGQAETATLACEVRVRNTTGLDQIAEVETALVDDATGETVLTRKARIQVDAGTAETAFISMTVEKPALWTAETPNLYRVEAKATDLGVFRTHFVEEETKTVDTAAVLFGIRTVTADVKNGLQINGKTVKLKGGCVHHDNGVIGAVSLYDAEVRRVLKMKEVGFNALRTTHNPPSAALIEACDRLGLYVFDEAFDAWGIAKRPGDYNQHFDTDWDGDLTAFVTRDRSHPSVIIWSTGNEIFERGGLNHGYTLATKLARRVKALDPSRPVSNGICSYWSGLDDKLMEEGFRKLLAQGPGALQNADTGKADLSWEEYSEPFTNGLDIVGMNYMEDKYVRDHELFPERIILGSENYPKEIGKRWPMVESLPYVLGDFTWTAWDYIGEAGIGNAFYVTPDDPRIGMGPFAFFNEQNAFPWRLANDADIDLTGRILPQGCYRSVVYGSKATHVFSYDPAVHGLLEFLSPWGFPAVQKNWNWKGNEGKPVTLLIFSRAEEVEVLVNGKSLGRRKAGETPVIEDMPCAFSFEAVYEPGEVVAKSFIGGEEVSSDVLSTTGEPASLFVSLDKESLKADGKGLIFASIEVTDAEGNLVPDAAVALKASVTGAGCLQGFGSANPITDENYSAGSFTSYRGGALAVVRAGFEPGTAVLTVENENLGKVTVEIPVE